MCLQNIQMLKRKESTLDLIRKIMLFDTFPFLCRLIGMALLVMALYGIGFPPRENIGSTSIALMILSVFFLLLPLSKKISIGKVLSFEREISRVKEDVSAFKSETREFLSVYSNMITAISNTVTQTVNVHLPGKEQVQEAKEELNSTLKDGAPSEAVEDELDAYLTQSGNDVNFALARMRMELERSLRELLGRRTETADPHSMQSKYLSARQLFREFATKFPNYQGMHSSFDYVLKVCNAAIHGQKISEGHAHEALYMGIKMLKEFEHVR